MKKKILLLIALFALLVPFTVNAEDEAVTTSLIQPREIGGPVNITNTPNEKLFEVGNSVNPTGYYNGTSFFAGTSVNTDATISGISFVTGNTVNIKGTAEYGFYAGSSVTVEGTVTDLFTAGSSIVITKDANITRDMYVAGSSISLSGNIERNAFLAASTVNIENANITGDITISSGNIKFGDNVVIKGSFKYNEDAKVEGLDKAQIANQEMYKANETTKESFGITLANIIIEVVGTIILGFVLILACPESVKKINKFNKEISIKQILIRMGLGLLALIIVPIVFLLLLSTIIGIQVSIVMIIVYVLAIYFSTVVASYIVGDLIVTKVFKKENNQYLAMLIGVPVLTIFSYVPYLGYVVGLVAVLTGVGILIKLITKKEA